MVYGIQRNLQCRETKLLLTGSYSPALSKSGQQWRGTGAAQVWHQAATANHQQIEIQHARALHSLFIDVSALLTAKEQNKLLNEQKL